MTITEIKITLPTYTATTPLKDKRLLAYVNITFGNCFVVHHIRIVKTSDGRLLVSMPSRKAKDGTHKDIAHPINQEFRTKLESEILTKFKQVSPIF